MRPRPQAPDRPRGPGGPGGPRFQTKEDLVFFAGQAIGEGRPVADLLAQPGALSPELERELRAAGTSSPFNADQRRSWLAAAQAAGPVSVHVRTFTALPRTLPQGEYDFVVALRFSVLSETAAALYDARTLPHELPAGQVARVFPLDRLRAAFEGVPDGDELRTGALHIVAPPELGAASGSPNPVLRVPFLLHVEEAVDGKHVPVTSLQGVLRFGVEVDPEVREDRVRIRFDGLTNLARDRLRIEVDGGSRLQPRSAEALAELEEFADGPLRLGVTVALNSAAGDWAICPDILLPVGEGIPLGLQRIHLRAIPSDDGGVLAIGMLLGVDAQPDEGAGDVTRLRDPFTTDAANVFAQAHEVFLSKVVRQALDSGELQRQADEAVRRNGGGVKVRVEGAGIELDPNAIRVILNVRGVDVCRLKKDLRARLTRTYRFSVFGGEIHVTHDDDINVNNWDTVACLLTSSLELVFGALLGGMTGVVVDAILQIRHFTGLVGSAGGGGDGQQFQIVNGVFDPRVPVPGTEVLPRVEVLQGLVSDDELRSNGVVSLREDDVNTYFYARFLREQLGTEPEPLAGARVEVMDQDVPPPARDDVTIPSSEPVIETKGQILSTRVTEFEPPSGDQLLAEGRTNEDGLVRFLLRPDQLRTTAGTAVTTTVTDNFKTGKSETKVDRRALAERLPDVYFRVRPAQGRASDTRKLPGGLMVNLNDKRIGSREAPVTFVLPPFQEAHR